MQIIAKKVSNVVLGCVAACCYIRYRIEFIRRCDAKRYMIHAWYYVNSSARLICVQESFANPDTLSLSANCIGPKGGKWLGLALAANHTLKGLK